MLNALTIDVEDYFQVNAFARTVRMEDWDRYPLRVDRNIGRVLELLARYHIRATFFILGWVAQRLPELVKDIQRNGHEIACHGHAHQLVYRIGPQRFREDIHRAKALLEDLGGVKVNGYRAPSYSITRQSLWALDILVEEGFGYDSSIFPVVHDTYGIPDANRFPHTIETEAGLLREFPLTTLPLKIGWKQVRLPIAGGGYLRLLPVETIRKGIDAVNNNELQPAVLYFHPWEIDPAQPRIKAGIISTFRHYLNLKRTEGKLIHLFERLRFAPMGQVLEGGLPHERPGC